jgi:hypothetical protein
VSTYANLPSAQGSKNAAITFLDLTKIRQTGTVISANGRVMTTKYVFVDTDPTAHTEISVRREVQADGTSRNSIRLATKVTSTVVDTDDTEEIYEGVLSWNHPRISFEDADDQGVFLSLLFSLLFAEYDGTSGVPDTTPLSTINFGITEDLWG